MSNARTRAPNATGDPTTPPPRSSRQHGLFSSHRSRCAKILPDRTPHLRRRHLRPRRRHPPPTAAPRRTRRRMPTSRARAHLWPRSSRQPRPLPAFLTRSGILATMRPPSGGYSIDEAFLDVAGSRRQLTTHIARLIRTRIRGRQPPRIQ